MEKAIGAGLAEASIQSKVFINLYMRQPMLSPHQEVGTRIDQIVWRKI